MKQYKPVVLIVLDGWGESPEKTGNAILNASLPTMEKIDHFYPKILLQASGISVGLPWGENGNSEVGHQAMGTGQIIYQSLPRITISIEDNSFFSNPAFLAAIEHAKNNNSALHLMGLVSDGGVHAHIDHLLALLELVKEKDLDRVFIHMITDGRDTGPETAEKFLEKLQKKMASLGIGQIATVAGRFFTMDRNENWDRIEKGYVAMVKGEGLQEKDPLEGIKKQYAKKVFDENLEPMVMVDDAGQPIGRIQDNDSIIFFNYREDRARQISQAFCQKGFSKFDVSSLPKNLFYVGMVEYEDGLLEHVAFPPQKIRTSLGKIIADHKLNQLRIAESEKYAHVTYFFNGGVEQPYSGEDHELVPSKKVDSYSSVPEMSAQEITDKVLAALKKKHYDFILINYANADMVGHTGDFKASIKAVETLDACMAQLIPAVLEQSGCLLVTADHGNAEEVINLKTGERDTEHSNYPVPCWLITPDNHQEKEISLVTDASGILSDITPTVLELLGIAKPADMESESLIPMLQ